MQQTTVDALGSATIAGVESGMIVGLGTGRTSSRAILALAQRVKDENLQIRCVPTSHATETLARSQGLNVVDFALVEKVDFLFDGADELDPEFRMIKGAGGAMTRERIVAHAASARIYIMHESKLVPKLGTKMPVPVAVLAFGLASVRAHLRNLGLSGVVRRSSDGHLFLTDNGNLVIDCTLPPDYDVHRLAQELDAMPGVVDHGLFLEEADTILVETASGVQRMSRPA